MKWSWLPLWLGPCLSSRRRSHEGFMDHRRQACSFAGGVREGVREVWHRRHRRAHFLHLLLLHLRQDPPRHDRASGARHGVLLPLRWNRPRIQLQNPACSSPHRVCRHRFDARACCEECCSCWRSLSTGDLGQTEWTASTLAHVAESNYDMLLLPGDLSYADTQQPLWDSFGRFVQPYASKRPWMVTEGNHDVEAFPVFHCHPFVAYDSRWRMPYEESGSASNLYYSFDVAGAVHVVMLGSYADFNASSAQYKWLVADLAKVDRRITPWLVALLHAPWYNTNLAHQGEGESMRQAMESLLYRARADVVFAGHVHAYERFVSLLLPSS